ncbi:hypothetical protein C6Y40_12735 [Alteromonas alba]|uniref:Orphan protein n=2 Tax=Alteromonas TaxID=226 RepID=A0A2S9V9R7_9ALTE|nr:hypothetical protein C6Y40_12735 [Alteromonas alba]|tara:strand:+ start:233 stop:754 length:522 start_codon:yes stop_codon:yes gene_type:complete
MTTKLNRVKSVMQAGLYALLIFMACGQAVAHQQKTAITTVLFNPRTENIEIMHRFNLHDAEHAVKALFKKTADILDDKETQTQFARYVSNRFVLFNAQNDSLPLNLVGFEVEGKHFWVYQETAQPPALEGLQIRHDALRDLWPEQVNTINVEGNGDLKTLTFTDSVELLEVHF